MAFDQEVVKQLSQELLGGYHLNAKLLKLLRHPLDSRGQEEAMAISHQLSRVFRVSLFMLKHDDNTVGEVRTAPEMRTDDSIGLCTPKEDKCISGVDVTPLRKGREEEVTRKEITPSPFKDGYQWRKYGQKKIQNSNFARCYYKCTFSRDRLCMAKKQVQQQDSTSYPPMFQVTYVNEHTCQEAVSNNNISTSLPATTTTPEVLDSTRNGASGFLPHISGSVEENKAIVWCLATVINGAAPSSSSSSWPLVEASMSDPSAYVAPAGHSPSLDGSMADEMMAEMDFSYGPSFSPVEAAELIGHCDAPMEVARFMDTVWHSTCDVHGTETDFAFGT